MSISDTAYVILNLLLTTFSQVGEMKAKETVLITGNHFYINKIKTIYFL